MRQVCFLFPFDVLRREMIRCGVKKVFLSFVSRVMRSRLGVVLCSWGWLVKQSYFSQYFYRQPSLALKIMTSKKLCSPVLIVLIFQALKGVVSQEKGKWERECVSPGFLVIVCCFFFLVFLSCLLYCCCLCVTRFMMLSFRTELAHCSCYSRRFDSFSFLLAFQLLFKSFPTAYLNCV